MKSKSLVARSLLKSLVKRYGLHKGAEVYIKMMQEKRGPFSKGQKYEHLTNCKK